MWLFMIVIFLLTLANTLLLLSIAKAVIIGPEEGGKK